MWHPDWKKILLKAHSVRWMLVTMLFTGLEAFVQFLPDIAPWPPKVFAGLTVFTSIGAFFARFKYQKEMNDDKDKTED